MVVLVFEGGAMRAAYASGVAVALQDARLVPEAVYGTSAGAAIGAWLAAGQAHVGARTWESVGDRRILSFRRAFRAPVIDFRHLYHELYPTRFGLDVAALRAAPFPVFATLTHAETGEARYMDLRHAVDPFSVLHATSAIPLLAECPAHVDDEPFVDGGVADPIPLRRALEDGARDVLLVLNRPAGARRPEPRLLVRLAARRFPALEPLLRRHHALHQEAIALAQSPPPGVRVRIVRPASPLGVSRLTRDPARIARALETGRRDGASMAARLGLPAAHA